MKHGDIIIVEWIDPQGETGWVEKNEEDIAPAHCTSVGFFNCYKDGNLLMYASYHDASVSDRNAIPKQLVKSIKKINGISSVSKGLRKGK